MTSEGDIGFSGAHSLIPESVTHGKTTKYSGIQAVTSKGHSDSLGLTHHPRDHINLKVVRKLTLALGKSQGLPAQVFSENITETIPSLGGQSVQPGEGSQESCWMNELQLRCHVAFLETGRKSNLEFIFLGSIFLLNRIFLDQYLSFLLEAIQNGHRGLNVKWLTCVRIVSPVVKFQNLLEPSRGTRALLEEVGH